MGGRDFSHDCHNRPTCALASATVSSCTLEDDTVDEPRGPWEDIEALSEVEQDTFDELRGTGEDNGGLFKFPNAKSLRTMVEE